LDVLIEVDVPSRSMKLNEEKLGNLG